MVPSDWQQFLLDIGQINCFGGKTRSGIIIKNLKNFQIYLDGELRVVHNGRAAWINDLSISYSRYNIKFSYVAQYSDQHIGLLDRINQSNIDSNNK